MSSPFTSTLTNFLAHPHSNKLIGLAATVLITLGLKRYGHYPAIASLYNLTPERAQETEYVIELEKMVNSLPFVQQLRKDTTWEESRGYPLMTEEAQEHHFTMGAL